MHWRKNSKAQLLLNKISTCSLYGISAWIHGNWNSNSFFHMYTSSWLFSTQIIPEIVYVAWPWKLLSSSIFKLSSRQYICFVLWPVMIPSWYWSKQIWGNSHGGSKPLSVWHRINFTVIVILSIFCRNVCFLKCHGDW